MFETKNCDSRKLISQNLFDLSNQKKLRKFLQLKYSNVRIGERYLDLHLVEFQFEIWKSKNLIIRGVEIRTVGLEKNRKINKRM